MNYFLSEGIGPDYGVAGREKLEALLYEAQKFDGTLRGDLANIKASLMMRELATHRRRNGHELSHVEHQAAWQKYFDQLAGE